MSTQIGAGKYTSVAEQPESKRNCLKSTGDETAENRLCGSHFVNVEGLRVMNQCEVNNRSSVSVTPPVSKVSPTDKSSMYFPLAMAKV